MKKYLQRKITQENTAKKAILFIVLSMFLVGNSAMAKNVKISKPTVFSIPTSYLAHFPLGVVTKNELIDNLGIPDKTTQFEDRVCLAYEVGDKNSAGAREYMFTLMNNIVVDVRYNDQGPYNGIHAQEIQNKIKKKKRDR